jgi:hypothetical protein
LQLRPSVRRLWLQLILPNSWRAPQVMGTKTTFICDCCHRETDSNLGWAHIHINGISDGRRLMPDDERDLCEICWSPLQTLMKKVQAEAALEAGKRTS